MIKALKPLLTPREIRDATVRDYTRAAERAGIRVDSETIERVAVADCELYDAVQRGASAAPAAPKIDRKRAERRDVLGDALDQNKAQLAPRSIKQSIPILNGKTKRGTRWSYALGRIKRIVEGANQNSDPRIAFSTCEIPKLAYEVFRLHAFVALRKQPPRPGAEQNPFYGLSNADFGRVLQRKIEDICDQSCGRMGPWFVPK